MRIARHPAGALLLVLTVLAIRCGPSGPQLIGSRSVSFGAARLDTQFHFDRAIDREAPLIHVLFVPQWDVPERRSYGTGGNHGGTRERLTFDYSYHDGSRTVRAQPVLLIDGKTIEAAGRTFDLEDGNVIVAAVNADGTLRVSQLRPPATFQDSSPEAVLKFVQSSLPTDQRVQQLTSRTPTTSSF